MRVERIDGRYELTEQISSGGMGSVWRGYDVVLDREVAIKLIRVDQVVTKAQAEEFSQRFQREARVTARIRHHGVPQVYDAVLDASYENVYLVMELIDGTPLRNYIDPSTPLPLAWVAAVAAQIATVLSHAHALPVVHRDLKPDNILVTRDGAVKVIDFGIAAMLDPDAKRLTSTGQIIGTLRYMSPESVHGLRVTPRSDLYALGCIMHEMACGSPIFPSESQVELMHLHAHVEPTPLRELRPDVPAEFERLVLDLVRKDPAARPSDAYAVYELLLPFLPGPDSAVPPTELYLSGFPDPTRVFRRPNAPLETDQIEPTRSLRPEMPPTAPLSAMHLQTAIENAERRYYELWEEQRFAQAADALSSVIASAGEVHGPDNAKVLNLRSLVAIAIELSGDHRSARREFDSLAAAYRRIEGKFSESAWDCRASAARCRMALGDIEEGLADMEHLVAEAVELTSDGSEASLRLRAQYGELLAGAGDFAGARDVLRPLYDDICLIKGPEDELAVEVAASLKDIVGDP
ncbi:serine/threonine-protein kinase [Nocardia sp. NRRL WC-3656]|uniref:serine/threonine-protein kinase n=1 Tax=Nocardia sp. NRRL WC-3656 TaxID=1463824 RepID=UPI0004C3AB21|nr:serine/threonine-protein kinase [Nocardia sp. NRRL WC-3656]